VKLIYWVASAKDDLDAMPAKVQDRFGFALYLAQTGHKHPDAKPLKGFGGAGVLEVVESFCKATPIVRCTCSIAFKRNQPRVPKGRNPIWN
jgi:phage-related protein